MLGLVAPKLPSRQQKKPDLGLANGHSNGTVKAKSVKGSVKSAKGSVKATPAPVEPAVAKPAVTEPTVAEPAVAAEPAAVTAA